MALHQPQNAEKKDSPLEDLADLLKEDLTAVNAVILEKLTSDVPLIPQIAAYLIAAGGKRIRPVLTLASATALGGNMERARNLAAIVEFIHSATLLHDDVVDESAERRGKASANEVFGNQASVLVGDFLFSRSFQLMVDDGSLKTLRILADASAIIAEGEVLQLQMQGNLETGWDTYIKMIGAKTAALFAAACEVGAVVSDVSSDVEKAMHDYGYNLGLAFQIADDMLDYNADKAALGKQIGDDFREGKISAPVLLAYAKATPEEKEFWQRTISKGEQCDGDLETAQSQIEKYGVIAEGIEKAAEYSAKAQKTLEILPPSPVKPMLEQLLTYVIERSA